MLLRDFDPLRIILVAPAILFALTFHEFAHAWVSYRRGDPTAKLEGRVSLNPLRHIDPFGTIALFLFGFGWAKPVPVNVYYLRRQVADYALTALAGPVANIVAALGFGLLYRLLLGLSVGGFLLTIVALSVAINLGLAAFNLVPIPPLDGSRVVYYLLPQSLAAQYIKLEPYGMWIVIGLLFLDSGTRIFSSWIHLFIRVLGGLFAGPGFVL
jgi:Zn-dependent protease